MEGMMNTTGRRDARAKSTFFPVYGAAESRQKQQPKRGGGGDGKGSSGGGPQKLAKKGKELKEEMDALVEEIDEVLE